MAEIDVVVKSLHVTVDGAPCVIPIPPDMSVQILHLLLLEQPGTPAATARLMRVPVRCVGGCDGTGKSFYNKACLCCDGAGTITLESRMLKWRVAKDLATAVTCELPHRADMATRPEDQ